MYHDGKMIYYGIFTTQTDKLCTCMLVCANVVRLHQVTIYITMLYHSSQPSENKSFS